MVLDEPAIPVRQPTKVIFETVARAGSRLVAGGEHGVILISDDDGRSWRQVPVPVLATITEIRFITAKIGWAVGHFGLVLRTDDAGEHWIRQLDGLIGAQIVLKQARAAAEAAPADGNTARMVRHANRLVSDGPDKPLFLIDPVSEQEVRVLGADGLAFITHDGGKSWLDWSGELADPRRLNIYGLVRQPDLMVVAGEQGLLMRGNPAQPLTAVASPYDGSFFGIVDGHDAGLHAYGLLGHDYVSHDSGQTWSPVRNAGSATLSAAVLLHDNQLLFADGAGMTYVLHGTQLDRLALSTGWPVTSVLQTPSGALVLAGAGGLERIDPEALKRALTGGES